MLVRIRNFGVFLFAIWEKTFCWLWAPLQTVVYAECAHPLFTFFSSFLSARVCVHCRHFLLHNFVDFNNNSKRDTLTHIANGLKLHDGWETKAWTSFAAQTTVCRIIWKLLNVRNAVEHLRAHARAKTKATKITDVEIFFERNLAHSMRYTRKSRWIVVWHFAVVHASARMCECRPIACQEKKTKKNFHSRNPWQTWCPRPLTHKFENCQMEMTLVRWWGGSLFSSTRIANARQRDSKRTVEKKLPRRLVTQHLRRCVCSFQFYRRFINNNQTFMHIPSDTRRWERIVRCGICRWLFYLLLISVWLTIRKAGRERCKTSKTGHFFWWQVFFFSLFSSTNTHFVDFRFP